MNATCSTITHTANRRNPIAAVGTWTDRVLQRRALAAFDPYMLSDIGLSADDRDRECRKPFWKG